MDVSQAEAARARQRERSAILAQAVGQPRTLFDSVRRRLVLVVLIAMAPIAALNFVQGVLQLQGAREEARQRLLQHALSAANSQENVFASAENVLHALKNVEDVRTAGPTCAATLRGATVSLPFAGNIGVIAPDGRVLCTALPVSERSVADAPWWREATTHSGFSLSGRVMSQSTRSQVLVGVLPLRDAAGRLEAAFVMGLEVSWLDNLLRQEISPATGIVALFSDSGEELVSNSRAMSATLFDSSTFEDPPPGGGTRLHESTDSGGTRWTFATSELSRDGLTIAFAMPSDRLFGWSFLTAAAAFALPALIMILSVAALWVAVDRIILRWLLYLRRVTAVYAQGHYGFRPSRLDVAPSEFRVLGHSVENMALAVRLRDARLRESLAEKTALVREIHHRIKNSLQVVVSLLSLYGSGLDRNADRRRFEQLRTRVNTLALVHRILYEASDGSQVRLRELLRELASLLEGAADCNVRLAVEAEDVRLPTDMAVPLALMVVEVVLHLESPADGTPGTSILRGEMRQARLRLTIESAPGAFGGKDGEADLATGFAAQLGGNLTRTVTAEGVRVVAGDFPCRSTGSSWPTTPRA